MLRNFKSFNVLSIIYFHSFDYGAVINLTTVHLKVNRTKRLILLFIINYNNITSNRKNVHPLFQEKRCLPNFSKTIYLFIKIMSYFLVRCNFHIQCINRSWRIECQQLTRNRDSCNLKCKTTRQPRLYVETYIWF